ncbi:MAG TPA: hypothetical protein VH165_24295 [Kofleriaceae bacterium]|nr:hypothetical protein [Kofleriaceae bacterium]
MKQVRYQTEAMSSHVRNVQMKAQNDMSLWSIIERVQRRLERQGMSPASADRALSIALRQLATAK